MLRKVREFEEAIAKYFGAPYAVATDCCTHALELSLRHTNAKQAYCPDSTYISVPFTLMKLNIDFGFIPVSWSKYYHITPVVIDAATLWEKNSYVPDTFMCLSFQFKKPLNLGRGGAILCPTKEDYDQLKKMAYDGRVDDKPWAEQDINSIGYHYYMTPETAMIGLEKLPHVKADKVWTWQDYPYLPNMSVFNERK